MLKNYLKIAYRNLLKNKVFSIVNILGLSVGAGCCLVIAIYILHALSYDRSFPNSERIYRMVQEQEQSGDLYQVASTPPALINDLRSNYPQVELATSFARTFNARLFQYKNKSFEEKKGFYIDSSFFEMFPLSIAQGSTSSFFNNPNSIIITKELARKYFGTQNPIGKVVKMDRQKDLVVRAVLKELPANIHIDFNFLLPISSLRSHRNFDEWGHNWLYTYILLDEKANPETFEGKISDLLTINIGNPNWEPRLYIQPLEDIYLYSNFSFNTDFAKHGSLQNIYLFGIVGLVILIIACINFINLTTAKSFERSKEVGVRKIVGASRKQLIYQFIGESLLYAVLSTALALSLAQFALPHISNFSGVELSVQQLGSKEIIAMSFSIVVIIGTLAGIYPSLLLSAFSTVKTLKGSKLATGSISKLAFSPRKIMVVCQFALSVILIVGAIVISQQMEFILQRDLGFDKEHIIYIRAKGDLASEDRFESFRSALLQQAGILHIGRSGGLPIDHEGSYNGAEWEGMSEGQNNFLMSYFRTDEHFVKTYNLEVFSGRDFDQRDPNDTSTYYIVNEAALKAMAMEDPIGKSFENGEIVGIMRDFNFKPAFTKVEPLVLRNEPKMNLRDISIRIAPENMRQSLEAFEKVYKQFNPDYPVDYQFLDQSIEVYYEQQLRLGQLINFFALLAVGISSLGLFGLTIFSGTQRKKEVGVRKVLGASAFQIVRLLSASFLKLILIGVAMAIPFSYIIIQNWLDSFAYAIAIKPYYFVLAGAVAIIITIITISFQTIKTALANPVDALRYE
ncbi:ABC transporter permease [Fulvivirgaceae bacterium BMA10]|uniref:ABC transporter permease n=1 Tax=Splendidivirga corallicola TaxID=3051826 RepID=A0ABT8KWG3_9BACT|nr:ABC transporter permease [Fulvivirgaceae bacterium BMA10]